MPPRPQVPRRAGHGPRGTWLVRNYELRYRFPKESALVRRRGGAVEPGKRPAPPGRGPRMRAAVLAATLAELADTGYAALTIEAIARRAGVHKTTIYRHWPDRESLVAD